jgi:hypothetical protein
VLLARTLADGFTAIDARRPEALAAVNGWLAEQGGCAKPHLSTRHQRSTFTALRYQYLHAEGLRALAPELEQLTQRLRALPVTDRAVRGGIQEVLRDYRNARVLIKSESRGLCEPLRALRRGEPFARSAGPVEDIRGSIRAVDLRGARLQAAQRALLAVEVDPRLARSLDSVFEHATGGLYRSRLQTRERLAPPFPIVTDPAELARLRAEATAVGDATKPLFAARRAVSRQFTQAVTRASRCEPALTEGADRRPVGVFALLATWLFGEIAAAVDEPVERFQADVAAVGVTDPALTALLERTSEQLEWIPNAPRINICSELRAWRRAGWSRRQVPDVIGDIVGGGIVYGIRLEDEEIDRAVLRRRGVPRPQANALLSPLDALIVGLETAGGAQVSSTQPLAKTVSAASAAAGMRAWRRPQAASAPAAGSAGAR